MEKLLTVEQVAEFLQVSKLLIYKWVYYKYIPYFKIGNQVRFKEASLDRWLLRKQQKGKFDRKISFEV